MNGIQDFDYTSRTASLKNRQSGVYAVSGEEKNGAIWKFRYLVEVQSTSSTSEKGDRVSLLGHGLLLDDKDD